MPEIALAELNIDVVYKDIKNVYLSVYPPSGMVRISAPTRLDLDTIRIFRHLQARMDKETANEAPTAGEGILAGIHQPGKPLLPGKVHSPTGPGMSPRTVLFGPVTVANRISWR